MVFHRMLKLAALPISVVFVQDGPERPALKRGIEVRASDHFMVDAMEDLATALGFQWRKVRIAMFQSMFCYSH